MNCPACGKSMVEKDFGGVKVDVCENGCKSIWFDGCELPNIDSHHEGFVKALKEALKAPGRSESDRCKLNCPICNISMQQHMFQKSKVLIVNECYKCGGFFMDSGELITESLTLLSDDEIEIYVKDLILEAPKSSEYFKKIKDEEEMKKHVENRRTLFTKLCKLARKRLDVGYL